MYDFISSHPGYLLLLLLNIVVVIAVFVYVGNSDDDSGNDGGEKWETEPELDLPPGVVLPSDSPKKDDPVLQD